MSKPLDLVLWKGKTAQMYVSQQTWDDGRTITNVSLHFPPGEFECPGWYHGWAVKAPQDGWDTEYATRLAYKRAWESVLEDREGKFTKADWALVRKARWDAMQGSGTVLMDNPSVEVVRTVASSSSDSATAVAWALDCNRWQESLTSKMTQGLSAMWENAFRTGKFPAVKAADDLMTKYPYEGTTVPQDDFEKDDDHNFSSRNVRVLLSSGAETYGWYSSVELGWVLFPVGEYPDNAIETPTIRLRNAEVARWGEIDDYSKLAEEVSRRNGKGN